MRGANDNAKHAATASEPLQLTVSSERIDVWRQHGAVVIADVGVSLVVSHNEHHVGLAWCLCMVADVGSGTSPWAQH